MLACLIRQVRDVHPGARICVISFNPSVTAGLHRVPSVSTRSRDVLSALAGCDTVLLGPGGIFHDAPQPGFDRHQSGISFYTALAAEASASGRAVATLGVGAGPLTTPTARRLIGWIGEVADPIVVRDQLSADRIGAGEVAPDLGWLRTPTDTTVNTNNRTIAVCVREWGTTDEIEATVSAVGETIDRVIDSGHVDEARFVVMEHGASATDHQLSERIISAMKHSDHATVAVPQSVDEAANEFATASLVLAMRFHAVLLAVAAGRRTVALAYDAKVEHLMVDAGLSDACFTLGTSPDALGDALTGSHAVTRSTVETLAENATQAYRSALATVSSPSGPLTRPSLLRYTRHRYSNAVRIRRGR